MKNLIIAVSLLTVISCSKSNNTNNGVNPSNNAPNTFTMTVGGTQYVAKGASKYSLLMDNKDWQKVTVETAKTTTSATQTFYVSDAVNKQADFMLDLTTEKGAPNGLGEFPIRECIVGDCLNTYKENFAGGLAFEITGGKVVTSKADNSSTEGTMTLEVSNGQVTKTVTGSFVAKDF